jgi:hypothetical protein
VKLIGKKISYEWQHQTRHYVIDEQNLVSILYENCGILINPPHWTQLPHYYRFVISITEEKFKKALERIKIFAKKVKEHNSDMPL